MLLSLKGKSGLKALVVCQYHMDLECVLSVSETRECACRDEYSGIYSVEEKLT